MDACVGRVLDALDAAGQADDTLVIYFGDHGYMLGQHGRFEKHCSYEEAVRVPLVMRWPKRIAAGRRTRALVELVDLAPTIHELCGYNVTAPLQGRSLLPLLEAKTTKHRDQVVVEYAQNEEVMIRDDDWKLVYERGVQRRTDGYDTGRPLVPHQFRLYDLYADAAEMHNVAADPANAATVKRLTDLLVEHLVTHRPRAGAGAAAGRSAGGARLLRAIARRAEAGQARLSRAAAPSVSAGNARGVASRVVSRRQFRHASHVAAALPAGPRLGILLVGVDG